LSARQPVEALDRLLRRGQPSTQPPQAALGTEAQSLSRERAQKREGLAVNRGLHADWQRERTNGEDGLFMIENRPANPSSISPVLNPQISLNIIPLHMLIDQYLGHCNLRIQPLTDNFNILPP
jgi:hypothetical protein